jgi:hypothetical protein
MDFSVAKASIQTHSLRFGIIYLIPAHLINDKERKNALHVNCGAVSQSLNSIEK